MNVTVTTRRFQTGSDPIKTEDVFVSSFIVDAQPPGCSVYLYVVTAHMHILVCHVTCSIR